MDLQQLGEGVAAFKNAIDIFKSAASLLPKRQRDDALEKAAQAEKAFKLAEAKTAQELGYPLCRCTFPPPIMRQQRDDSYLCPTCDRVHDTSGVSVLSDDDFEFLRARR